MNATTRTTTRVFTILAGALLVAASTANAEAPSGRQKDRRSHQRYEEPARGSRQHQESRTYRHVEPYARPMGRWVAPAPRVLPRPRALPRPHAFAVPRAIPVYGRHFYSPYYAGRVFYDPYGIDLDLYYFPVTIGGRLVYQPYYYYGDQLFFSLSAGTPHFYLQFRF